MRLQTVQPPKAALAVLNLNIGVHLSRKHETVVSSYKPIKQVPVYVIDHSEPISVSEFEDLKPAGWRFILSGSPGNHYATGDVTATGKSYKLSAVTTDQSAAQQLLAGIDSAKRALQNQGAETRLDLRILEAPAFHVRVLWLHNHGRTTLHGDLFSVVNCHRPQPREGLITVDELIELLNKALSAKLRRRGGFSLENEPETSPSQTAAKG
jgi:hypothetical protein